MKPKNQPVKVLLVNGNTMDRGGIEAFLMNYYRHMDQKKVCCDFIVHGYEKGIYNEEIEQLGGRIYHVPTKSRHPFKYQKELMKIFQTGDYQVVHSHLDAMNSWVLKLAKRCGIPVRIAHSHNTSHLTNNKLKLLINEYARKNITKYATHYFACSELAGRWLFGNAWDKKGSQILNNAVDFSLYTFRQDTREKLRQFHQIADEFVIGHVGRFSYQKNHEFLLDIFAQLRTVRAKVKLVLIGEGENRKEIEEKIIELGIADSVLLLGSVNNAYDYYNMMDLFVLPSRFEGLPVVAVEAQVNGLSCFLSDKITKEVCLTDKIKLIGIDSADCWVRKIDDFIKQYDENERGLRQSSRLDAYNIRIAVKRLENLYMKYVRTASSQAHGGMNGKG